MMKDEGERIAQDAAAEQHTVGRWANGGIFFFLEQREVMKAEGILAEEITFSLRALSGPQNFFFFQSGLLTNGLMRP